MNSLSQYIIEKFKISKNIKLFPINLERFITNIKLSENEFKTAMTNLEEWIEKSDISSVDIICGNKFDYNDSFIEKVMIDKNFNIKDIIIDKDKYTEYKEQLRIYHDRDIILDTKEDTINDYLKIMRTNHENILFTRYCTKYNKSWVNIYFIIIGDQEKNEIFK